MPGTRNTSAGADQEQVALQAQRTAAGTAREAASLAAKAAMEAATAAANAATNAARVAGEMSTAVALITQRTSDHIDNCVEQNKQTQIALAALGDLIARMSERFDSKFWLFGGLVVSGQTGVIYFLATHLR